REKVMTLSSPFKGEPAELMKLQHRFAGIRWFAQKDRVLLTEYDRERRWRTTYRLSLSDTTQKHVLFDLSINDAYKDPGAPLTSTDAHGTTLILQDGDWIYLSGRGASDKGDLPFLDKLNLVSNETQRLYRSDESSLEQFISFAGGSRDVILTRYENPITPPNYFLVDLATKSRTALTDFKDPAPQMTGMKKELIKYKRPDGVPLSGTLYLPPGYKEGTRLPLIVWAYPMEYSDASTAGQVRGSTKTFTFFRGASPLFYVTQGYAVLMDATMPVVGDPETMNDTFVEQIVAAAKAAIDTLDHMGVIDRNRVGVSGHSYGAFMTANLLAHSDLFAAGIARSGAYNRTLTPFGFQSERRSFWEARDVYMNVSPFTHADKIKRPLLMFHGEADNNTGTFPIQSERLFNAIKGNGGTARLVMLPFESHGYSARESVLHVLAESFEWADKYIKNKGIAGK
ncbi:MAG TPA: prolyl oligopeptidase family serine peptidase, partial [Bacteroidota bacterium]|nr:prolyl oligopeptidase family serine peptidase [Bacteroidota bacterium]